MKKNEPMEDPGLSGGIDIEKLLAEGNNIEIAPQGWSMYPFFVPGKARVIVEPYTAERLKQGMVVLYRRPESILVIHRIHHVSRAGLYLVGDNQTEIEGPLDSAQVRGIMAGFYRTPGKEKFISVHDPSYVLLSRVWLFLRPLRPAVSAVVHRIRPYGG